MVKFTRPFAIAWREHRTQLVETRRGYGIPEGRKLREEIGRAYRMAEAEWIGFDAAGSASFMAGSWPGKNVDVGKAEWWHDSGHGHFLF